VARSFDTVSPHGRRAGVPPLAWWLLLTAVGCGERLPSAAGTPLPQTIDGLPLVQLVSGTRAARAVARLHDRDVAPDASWIGRYALDREEAVVYASRYRTGDAAQGQLDAMAARIGTGTPQFGHHRAFDVAGRAVHAALSPGAIHYFFVRETDLLWMSIRPARARAALADVLGIPADSIPVARPPASPRPQGG
jgi:hypothetical protein